MKYREGIDYHAITCDQMNLICETLKGADIESLRMALDDAAERFIYNHFEQQTFPHAWLEKRLLKIETATKKLLSALDFADSIELESILNYGLGGGRKNKIAPIVEDLKRLRDTAVVAATAQARQKNPSKARNIGNHALTALLGELRLAFMAQGEWPGFTVNAHEEDESVGGDFVVFMKAVLTAVIVNLSSAVISSDPNIVRSLQVSGEAIRAAMRRMENDMQT